MQWITDHPIYIIPIYIQNVYHGFVAIDSFKEVYNEFERIGVLVF